MFGVRTAKCTANIKPDDSGFDNVNKNQLMKKLFVILLGILVVQLCNSQDTLWLVNGRKIAISGYELIGDSTTVRIATSRGHHKRFATETVFSVMDSLGVEKIWYQPNGDDYRLEPDEMRNYIDGEYKALTTYKPRWAFASGFALGAVSPFLIGDLAPILPLSGSILLARKPKSSHFAERHNLVDANSHFTLGYKDIVRKKRVTHSLMGAGLGFATAVLVYSLTK